MQRINRNQLIIGLQQEIEREENLICFLEISKCSFSNKRAVIKKGKKKIIKLKDLLKLYNIS